MLKVIATQSVTCPFYLEYFFEKNIQTNFNSKSKENKKFEKIVK